MQRQASLGMTAHERQMRYLEDYVYRYGRSERAANVGPQRNDYDVLAERHRSVKQTRKASKSKRTGSRVESGARESKRAI